MSLEPTEMELRVAQVIFSKMFPERPEDFEKDARLMECYIDTARAAIDEVFAHTPVVTMLDGEPVHELGGSPESIWAMFRTGIIPPEQTP